MTGPAGATAASATPARVPLTDQALVAVAVARRCARPQPPDPAGDPTTSGATVAHLLVGLASEPEGVAGRCFRPHDAAAVRLADRVAAAPPRLPAIEVAIGWAAGAVRGRGSPSGRTSADPGGRPLWTVDLLAAALEVGGSDLADVLDACGLEPDALASAARAANPDELDPAEAVTRGDALPETRGYDPDDEAFTAPAARAVARARAVAGGAVALLVALAAEQAVAADAVPLDPDELAGRLRATRGAARLHLPAPTPNDRGLEAVVGAARRICPAEQPVAPLDLLRAAILAGGELPAALLAPPPPEDEP